VCLCVCLCVCVCHCVENVCVRALWQHTSYDKSIRLDKDLRVNPLVRAGVWLVVVVSQHVLGRDTELRMEPWRRGGRVSSHRTRPSGRGRRRRVSGGCNTADGVEDVVVFYIELRRETRRKPRRCVDIFLLQINNEN